MRKALAIYTLGLAAAVSSSGKMPQSTPRKKVKPIKKQIENKPPGANEYFFNNDGWCNVNQSIDDCVFTCYSRDKKNAIRKFENWKFEQIK